MAYKKFLEAFDRTMKDLRKNQNRFGGAMILLARDFCQTLPVIPRSTPMDELKACVAFDRSNSVLIPSILIIFYI